MMPKLGLAGFRVWLCFCLVATAPLHAETVTIAAASSLRPRLDALISAIRDRYDIDVRASYAASGTLAQQILRGAPYALFLSAAPEHLQPLKARGLLCQGPVLLGYGRLVLFVPHHAEIALRADLLGLATSARWRLAVADPGIAPFGRLARQALRAAGLWDRVQPHLVYGESAAQAARFALSGAVDAALLPAHLMREPLFARRGRWVAVQEALYRPTPVQAVGLCPSSEAAALVFDHLRRYWRSD